MIIIGKKGDLLMIDNKRFMHGRRAYKKRYKRHCKLANC